MIGLVKSSVEKKLSAILGTAITFESLNLSIFSASVEATGIRVAGGDPDRPAVVVSRVRAELSLAAAIRKEFVIKSLTIEKPTLTIVRAADGSTNLPKRPAPRKADTRQTPSVAADTSITGEDKSTWRFDVKKVLVVDAAADIHCATGYHASISGIHADLHEANGGMECTAMADSVRRIDTPAEIGSVQFHAIADDMPSLTQWQSATVTGTINFADFFTARINVKKLQPLNCLFEFAGQVTLSAIRSFIPDDAGPLAILKSETTRGAARLSGTGSFEQDKSIQLSELNIQLSDVAIAGIGVTVHNSASELHGTSPIE